MKISAKNDTFSAIKSIFAPQGYDRITLMDLNESQEHEAMDEDILFEICSNLFPPMTHQMTKIEKWECFRFLNSINGVQR